MKPGHILIKWGAYLTIERPVRKLPIPQLLNQLEQSKITLSDHLNACPDTPDNRRLLCHLVGIERWGQRRLRVALGEPFLAEEYDHYRPSTERSWDELKREWDTTRQATLELVNTIIQANPSADLKINHNQYGSLSIKGWLRYLDVHASGEGKHIKIKIKALPPKSTTTPHR
jgi:hypothetical protein